MVPRPAYALRYCADVTDNTADVSVQVFTPGFSNGSTPSFSAKDDVTVQAQMG
jgi:hypothetical protein